MGLDVYSRRKHKQGKFVYLLDDEEKTAWIRKGTLDAVNVTVSLTM